MSANSIKKIFSWKVAILLLSFGTIGLLLAILSVFIQTRSQNIQTIPIETTPVQNLSLEENPKSVVTTTATVGFGSSFEVPDEPSQIIIPAIDVNAKIQSVGLSWKNNGEMGVPTNFTDVAWYNQGPPPGMPGSAVIAGHLDGKNVEKAVFYNLNKLKQGDLIEIIDRGRKKLQFKVVDIKIYDYTAPTNDVFSNDTSKIRLNLITCAGDWIKSKKLYDERIVVFTELIIKN